MYAKTDKYYVKKFEAETNITGYLVMDLSRSMGYTYRQELTKFDYVDLPGRGALLPDDPSAGPGGLITFDEKIRQQPAAAFEAHAIGQRVVAAGRICGRPARPTSPKA